MTVYDYIADTLVGKECIYNSDVYIIRRVTISRHQMSVAIENDNDLLIVPMSAAQIESAVEKSL